MVSIETIQSVDAFARLRDEWTELLAASAADCLFLTWEWLFTWWTHLSGRRTLSIVAVRADGRLIGLAPLAIRPPSLAHLFSMRTLEFLGTGQVGSDYLDVIVRRGAEHTVMPALSQHFAACNLVIGLRQIDLRNGTAWRFGRALAGRGWSASYSATDVCPYVDLKSTEWTRYLDRRGASVRANFRRRLRQLEQIGPVTLEAAVTDAQRRAGLERLIGFHLQRWERRGGSEAFHEPALIAFHEDFSRLALSRGWLRLFTLRCGERAVASWYCFRYGDAMLFYQSGFDETLAKHSVGLVAMGLSIKKAIEEGAAEYDLLHGSEEYKFQWAGESRQIGRLELYPPHLLGALCRRSVAVNRTLKRFARSVWPGAAVDHVASVH
jgi:CelD/BcsL family acetyltransferase involved in cellulose biosynthesis